jgi:hypothetical protein
MHSLSSPAISLHLVPAQDGGAVTAGNSSPITDGACALVLVSAAKAAELGCPVLAVLRGYGDANQDPEWFTTAPAAVTPKVRLTLWLLLRLVASCIYSCSVRDSTSSCYA